MSNTVCTKHISHTQLCQLAANQQHKHHQNPCDSVGQYYWIYDTLTSRHCIPISIKSNSETAIIWMGFLWFPECRIFWIAITAHLPETWHVGTCNKIALSCPNAVKLLKYIWNISFISTTAHSRLQLLQFWGFRGASVYYHTCTLAHAHTNMQQCLCGVCVLCNLVLSKFIFEHYASAPTLTPALHKAE